MTVRLIARAMLAAALLVPVVTFAAPRQAAPFGPTTDVVALWMTVDPVDAQHTRFVFRLAEGGFATYDAKSATQEYTTRGLGISINGPGTMTFRGQTTPFETASWRYDGYLRMGSSK